MTERLGRQAHRHRKGTAVYLGPLASGSHCPSSAPEESAVSRIPHILLLGPCLSSTANLRRSILWQPQKHRQSRPGRERHGDSGAQTEGELAARETEIE